MKKIIIALSMLVSFSVSAQQVTPSQPVPEKKYYLVLNFQQISSLYSVVVRSTAEYPVVAGFLDLIKGQYEQQVQYDKIQQAKADSISKATPVKTEEKK